MRRKGPWFLDGQEGPEADGRRAEGHQARSGCGDVLTLEVHQSNRSPCGVRKDAALRWRKEIHRACGTVAARPNLPVVASGLRLHRWLGGRALRPPNSAG